VKAERLEREFADRAVPTGSRRLLLSPADALALVNRAAEEGVPIVGIDGLRVGESSTEPALEHIAEFATAVAQGHGCWQDAEAVIRGRRAPGLVFALALGDDPVEAV